ncbi:MAG: ABC transporter substrate-binding protein [Deltaproteobacteria bacterium]|nr:ABC transporter substrate-binding protein [Deltaproteobacteria bacterium]
MKKIVCLLVLFFLPACLSKKKNEIWIYTSIYKDMVEQMKPDVEKNFPEYKLQWFSAGSEKVGAKIQAELAANHLNADLVMTSDPFFYLELKHKGLLLAYASVNAQNVPESLKDYDHAFATLRVPVVVMAYHQSMLGPHQIPKTFKELTEPKWKGKVVMGSPLESGTTFTAVATLVEKYGWDFFKKLRENQVVPAGGNSTVRQKLEAKEFPIGIILLENILQAKSQGSPLEAIYPEDGAILVPSPIAIFKRTPYPEVCQKIVDYFFSEAGQQWMVKSFMYAANPMLPPPVGAKTFGFVLKTALPWNQSFSERTLKDHQKIKETFSKLMYD